MKKKHDCGWKTFGMVVIWLAIIGGGLFWLNTAISSEPISEGVPVTQYVPEDEGQVFVKVNFRTPMINTLRCWDDVDYINPAIEVNNTFLFIEDERTIINKVQGLVYRIRINDLRNGFDLMSNPDFKNALNQTKTKGSYYLKCKTDLFANGEATAEIYDEGYKEIKTLNLYRYMNIVCIYTEPNGWDCRYDNDRDLINLPSEITRHLVARITE